MVATKNLLTFEQAIEMLYVAVKRGKEIVILAVRKIMTRFLNGKQMRVMILSDGSHYSEESFKGVWEVKRV